MRVAMTFRVPDYLVETAITLFPEFLLGSALCPEPMESFHTERANGSRQERVSVFPALVLNQPEHASVKRHGSHIHKQIESWYAAGGSGEWGHSGCNLWDNRNSQSLGPLWQPGGFFHTLV